jgi:hypothetical protein
MSSEFSYTVFTELGLLGGPIIGLLLYALFKENRKFIFLFLSVLAFLGLFRLFNLSFKVDSLDLLFPIVFFIAYCYLFFHFQLIDNKFLRVISLVVGSIPIIFSFLFGIIGIFGVGMASADEVSDKTVNLNNSCYFRVYQYGNAISEKDGTRIEIYKSGNFLPFIEKRILQTELDRKNFETDSISVKFVESQSKYLIEIYSKHILQVDTTITK